MSEIIEGRSRRPFRQKIGPNEFTVIEKQRVSDEQEKEKSQYTGGRNFLIETDKRQMEYARSQKSAADYNSMFRDTRPQTQVEIIAELKDEIDLLKRKVSFLESEK